MTKKKTTAAVTDLTVYRVQAGDLEAEKKEASSSLAMLGDFKMETDDDSEFIAGFIRDVKAKWKEIDDRRTSVTGPLHKIKTEIDSWFRPGLDELKALEAKAKSMLAEYERKKEIRQRNALAIAAKAESVAQAEAALALAAAPTAPPVGITIRKVWKWRVFSPDIVPDAMRCPDLDKIDAHVRHAVAETGAPTPIPGVEFWQEDCVASRQG